MPSRRSGTASVRLFTMDGWTGWSDSLMDVAVWPPGPASKRGEPVEVGHRRGEVRVLVAVSRSRPTVLGWFCGFTILHAADPEPVVLK